jgi:hypothetical protein
MRLDAPDAHALKLSPNNSLNSGVGDGLVWQNK